jgi:hypothetical protein
VGKRQKQTPYGVDLKRNGKKVPGQGLSQVIFFSSSLFIVITSSEIRVSPVFFSTELQVK